MIKDEIDQIIRYNSSGELKGFSDLYRQYAGMIRSVLFKLCNPDDLDDLVQEAFIRILNALPKFAQRAQLKTWVYRITYNLAIDDLRKRKRKGLQIEYKEEVTESKEQDMINRDQIQKGLQRLNENYRTVLVLSYMEGLTDREVAEVIQVPEGTVKTWLRRAKNKMGEFLNKTGAAL